MMGAGSADEVPAGPRKTPANWNRTRYEAHPLKRSFPAQKAPRKLKFPGKPHTS